MDDTLVARRWFTFPGEFVFVARSLPQDERRVRSRQAGCVLSLSRAAWLCISAVSTTMVSKYMEHFAEWTEVKGITIIMVNSLTG